MFTFIISLSERSILFFKIFSYSFKSYKTEKKEQYGAKIEYNTKKTYLHTEKH